MIFNQYCVFTIFFGILCNIQFMTCSWFKETSSQETISEPETFDDTEELKVALKLDTGFSYEPISLIFETNLDELKGMIIKEEKPKSFILFTKPEIMYYDLYCSNLYNLLQYTSHLEYLLNNEFYMNKNKYDYLLLNEIIIKKMLSVLLKLDLTIYLKPFWYMYMFAIYIKKMTLDDYLLVKSYAIETLKRINKYLSSYAIRDCRKNNKYDLTDQFNEEKCKLDIKDSILKIEDVISIMIHRNNINNILLHGEEAENWVSLKKIYFYEIIQNTDILKTIIEDFGEQSEENYIDIIKDLNIAYQAAKNYYWFDEWISKIKVYHNKIFNIFRVVILHLIRKHQMYLINENDEVVIEYNNKMWDFFFHNFYIFHKMLFSDIADFKSISTLFKNKPSNSNETYDVINSNIISNIENKIQKAFVVKSFEILPIEVDNEIYNENSIKITKKLSSYVQLSKVTKFKIKRFQNISSINGLNDNFLRLNVFLEYLMKVFISEHKFKVFETFMNFSSDFEITKDQEVENERYLDLKCIY
ncbi:uncharacterized protein LOC126893591 isoform X1 [Daktulosphaira vitifoliae]|uniref:uncharacterized protein LOC126893591 isoform X1 n=1 Tax=Daktulosphaira vitifoliae TaxID=58002 RepID=UPI0021AAFC42|nr:uncharacterized protein LOC126893591 isoform X1 [Daktulosphaira vitifoliae]